MGRPNIRWERHKQEHKCRWGDINAYTVNGQRTTFPDLCRVHPVFLGERQELGGGGREPKGALRPLVSRPWFDNGRCQVLLG